MTGPCWQSPLLKTRSNFVFGKGGVTCSFFSNPSCDASGHGEGKTFKPSCWDDVVVGFKRISPQQTPVYRDEFGHRRHDGLPGWNSHREVSRLQDYPKGFVWPAYCGHLSHRVRHLAWQAAGTCFVRPRAHALPGIGALSGLARRKVRGR